jgi:hypothetical protein
MPTSKRVTPRVLGRLFAGWVLILGGGILTPLPIPVGLVLLSLGLALLAQDSRWVRRRLRWLLGRYPAVSDRLRRMEPYCPGWLAGLLRRIQPKRQANDGQKIRDS